MTNTTAIADVPTAAPCSETRALIDHVVRHHLSDVLSAAVKEYAARFERDGHALDPPVDRHAVTATEVVIVASELIRAVDLNLFDVAMWYRRPVDPNRGLSSQGAAGG